MPVDSIREKVLQRIQNLLAAIQSGLVVEPSNALPEPIFLVMDGCNDQESVDGWIPSSMADPPTLNTTFFAYGPGAINLLKTMNGGTATYTKTLLVGFDATRKIGVMGFRPTIAKLSPPIAVTLRFGNDGANYWEYIWGTNAMVDLAWGPLSVNIDGGDLGGAPATVVGTPDKTDIKWLEIVVQPVGGVTDFLPNEIIMDEWVLFDTTSWLPSGGSTPPELIFDNQAVIGTYSIGFGHLSGFNKNFGIIKTFDVPFDGTGGEIEAWTFVRDKTKLSNAPPLNYSVGIAAGSDDANWYARLLFHDEIRDIVNDRGSGWNRIIFDPLTESDFIAGSPTIDNLKWFLVGAIADDINTYIPVEDMRLDFIRIIGPDGLYNHDIKRVHRYSISSQQTTGSPSMTMAALNEDQETEIYPIISSKLIIGIDTEIELPSEALLDQELGRAQDDIQIALASQQELWGIARYIKVLNLEFHVREGTHTGILTTNIEVAFTFNQLDPTQQGVV